MHKTNPEISVNEAIGRPSTVISSPLELNPSGNRSSKRQARPVKIDSIPIALARPPQTRAASFKRLYPK
jgi:hypothetical protein